MAKLIRGLIFASLLLPAAAQAHDSKGEIGYQRGALGYDALMGGNYGEAEKQIQAAAASSLDPAQMLNLGIVYLNTSRTSDAQAMFTRAANSKEHFPVLLSNGQEVDSRLLARQLLAKANSRLAIR